MNKQEISIWFSHLFAPADAADTTDAIRWEEQSAGGRHYGVHEAAGYATVVTLDFSEFDTGLFAPAPPQAQTPGSPAAVRVELCAIATASYREALTQVVQAAVARLENSAGHLPAQPGTILADLHQDVEVDLGAVTHGLLIAPNLWEQGVPHLWESAEDRGAEHGQMTLPLQLLMITPDELAYAVTYSVAELLEQMPRQGIDARDFSRR